MSYESLEHVARSRVWMFLRHTWLVTILGTLLLGAAVWAAIHFTMARDYMRIAAGPLDARFVHALSNQLATDHRNLHLQIVPTTSPQATAEAMSKGEADLAVLPSQLDNARDWPVVTILRQNVMALIVPAAGATKVEESAATKPAKKTSAKGGKSKGGESKAGGKNAKGGKGTKSTKGDASDDSDSSDSKFGKVTDLAGKRVGVVSGNEATTGLLELVLSHYGVPRDKVTISSIDPRDIPAAIRNHQVDVLFVAAAATSPAISSVIAAATVNGAAPNFIEIDQADGIAKRNPAFDSIDIDAGTFGGTPPTPDDSLKTLSFAQYLVARKSDSDSVIATLAKTIYSSRQALAAAVPGEIKIEAPSTDKDADAVVHPGALTYLNDNQQSFFDKYGDAIFYGLLIFPVFGSALAGMASYLRRDNRTRRLRLLQRVLDLVRKAHGAQNLEALEQLQVEADNLVIAIVHQGEREEFDETVRMSFAFALDQLRFAIAARRTAILDHSGTKPEATAPAAATMQTAFHGQLNRQW
ncbi:MAG TPA: TAXI family TRAP transporter solute-binding subunit [Pseudolabrys sp.]